MLSRSDRNRLFAIGQLLEQRRYKADADLVGGIVERFDGSEGFTAIHTSALAQRVDAPADQGLDDSEPVQSPNGGQPTP
jgi:hypothetical protein